MKYYISNKVEPTTSIFYITILDDFNNNINRQCLFSEIWRCRVEKKLYFFKQHDS